MHRVLLLVSVTVATCLAQFDATRAFVNPQHLPTVNRSIDRHDATPPCVRVPWQERIPIPKNVDPKMVIPAPVVTGDEKMVVKSPPFCEDK